MAKSVHGFSIDDPYPTATVSANDVWIVWLLLFPLRWTYQEL